LAVEAILRAYRHRADPALADAEQANIIYLLTLTPDEEEDASEE